MTMHASMRAQKFCANGSTGGIHINGVDYGGRYLGLISLSVPSLSPEAVIELRDLLNDFATRHGVMWHIGRDDAPEPVSAPAQAAE